MSKVESTRRFHLQDQRFSSNTSAVGASYKAPQNHRHPGEQISAEVEETYSLQLNSGV
ncbi:hypothetical protein CRE_14962 [Caenorhabditis remanei]|uniref:Uncharacterized protein n=1 Tax=Caenorhabditis remanei TaxID=31234 RepID=E3NBY2_CAERE|nr:hypothetical protein CRE_14962 [Caenorhabditis remanei]